MKLDWKEDGKRLLGVLAGGFLMALNLKSFVSAGGLLPGGANGLTVLLQRIALTFFNVSAICVPSTLETKCMVK